MFSEGKYWVLLKNQSWEKGQVKRHVTKLKAKCCASKATVRYIISVGHGESTHEKATCSPCIPWKDQIHSPWKSSSHSLPCICYYGFSLSLKSKFWAVLQQLPKITSNLDFPSILQLYNCGYHCLASYKLESSRKHCKKKWFIIIPCLRVITSKYLGIRSGYLGFCKLLTFQVCCQGWELLISGWVELH